MGCGASSSQLVVEYARRACMEDPSSKACAMYVYKALRNIDETSLGSVITQVPELTSKLCEMMAVNPLGSVPYELASVSLMLFTLSPANRPLLARDANAMRSLMRAVEAGDSLAATSIIDIVDTNAAADVLAHDGEFTAFVARLMSSPKVVMRKNGFWILNNLTLSPNAQSALRVPQLMGMLKNHLGDPSEIIRKRATMSLANIVGPHRELAAQYLPVPDVNLKLVYDVLNTLTDNSTHSRYALYEPLQSLVGLTYLPCNRAGLVKMGLVPALGVALTRALGDKPMPDERSIELASIIAFQLVQDADVARACAGSASLKNALERVVGRNSPTSSSASWARLAYDVAFRGVAPVDPRGAPAVNLYEVFAPDLPPCKPPRLDPLRVISECPNGHGLGVFKVPRAGFACDLCRSAIPAGQRALSCRLCNYDLCANCVERAGNAVVVEAAMLPIVATLDALEQHARSEALTVRVGPEDPAPVVQAQARPAPPAKQDTPVVVAVHVDDVHEHGHGHGAKVKAPNSPDEIASWLAGARLLEDMGPKLVANGFGDASALESLRDVDIKALADLFGVSVAVAARFRSELGKLEF